MASPNQTSTPRFFAAIGTPLDRDENLHEPGLKAHIDDQWNAGVAGILVAGTMGLMPLLLDTTYQHLIEASAEHSAGRGEVLVGVGDVGLARTCARITAACRCRIDGVVALCPYFVSFSQDELVDYYRRLADHSAVPLFVYHLPGLTRVQMEVRTVVRIAEHPNVHGIKCSCDFSWTRRLMQEVGGAFRVIVAQAGLVDALCAWGVSEQVDGVFALAPAWTVAIGESVAAGDLPEARAYQRRLNELLDVVQRYGVFPSFSALLNARGIPGNYAPEPYRPLDAAQQGRLLREPIVRELLAEHPVPESAVSAGFPTPGAPRTVS